MAPSIWKAALGSVLLLVAPPVLADVPLNLCASFNTADSGRNVSIYQTNGLAPISAGPTLPIPSPRIKHAGAQTTRPPRTAKSTSAAVTSIAQPILQKNAEAAAYTVTLSSTANFLRAPAAPKKTTAQRPQQPPVKSRLPPPLWWMKPLPAQRARPVQLQKKNR